MAEQIELTLVLRQPAAGAAISKQLLAGSWEASKATAADVSADPEDIKAVTQFAASHNLQVLKTDAAARSIRVAGSVSDIENALGIHSDNSQVGSVESLDYKGPVNLPQPLNGIVISVLGLDHTAIARSHVQ